MTIVRLVAVGVLLALLAACQSADTARPTLPGATMAPATGNAPTTAPAATDAPPGGTAPAASPTEPASFPTPLPEQEAPSPSDETPSEGFPAPPDRDLYRLARELIPGLAEIQPSVAEPAQTLTVGHRQSFELVDLDKLERYRSEFELKLVTPHAYWFVEDGVRLDQDEIEESAEIFETSTYPLITKVFGTEWTPGIDGDPHLYILNASLALVGGYYSPSDEYPREIRPVSNEIEAVYINVRYISPGTETYDQVLAHELQHAIHWNADPDEDTWLNEGLSELAVTLAGYEERSVHAFRRAGPTSLTNWPSSEVGGGENYGAASLFMQYLTGHYGGREDLRPLLSGPSDGIEGVDAYLDSLGRTERFDDVFRDWAVANLLDEPDGKYGYDGLDITFPVSRILRLDDELSSVIPQYSTEYLKIDNSAPATLTFEGSASTPLLPVDVGNGCWWSNSGDSIDARLTAIADLRGLSDPSLNYQAWYAIEEDWDYAYLELSTDGGRTWQILETPNTSSHNPIASAFGPGYTGSSEGWLDESVSLRDWAGQEVMLRFQYITDAALNDHGLCVRNLGISDSSQQPEAPEWVPNGFQWTNNLVRQRYNVQVIYEGKEESDNRVEFMSLTEANIGTITLQPDPKALRAVVAVQAMAPSTRLPSSYTVRLESARQ